MLIRLSKNEVKRKIKCHFGLKRGSINITWRSRKNLKKKKIFFEYRLYNFK